MIRAIPRRGLLHPGLHFLLLGGALFFGRGWLDRAEVETAGLERVLEIRPARVEQLNRQWLAAYRRPPTDSETDWLVQQWIEEEILYREAVASGLDRADHSVCTRLVLNLQFLGLDDVAPDPRQAGVAVAQRAELATATGVRPVSRMVRDEHLQALCERARELGLDRGDPVIRRQMATMMRLLLRRGVPAEEPTREQLEDYVARHSKRFLAPERVRWSQVFLSRDRRGQALPADAARLLARLEAGEVRPEEALGLGDPLPVGAPPELASERNLTRRLGKPFAREVMELPAARWSRPLRSAFGLHLVWIHERLPGELRPFSEIEEEARRGLESERQEQSYALALGQLLGRWQVTRVEGDEA